MAQAASPGGTKTPTNFWSKSASWYKVMVFHSSNHNLFPHDIVQPGSTLIKMELQSAPALPQTRLCSQLDPVFFHQVPLEAIWGHQLSLREGQRMTFMSLLQNHLASCPLLHEVSRQKTTQLWSGGLDSLFSTLLCNLQASLSPTTYPPWEWRLKFSSHPRAAPAQVKLLSHLSLNTTDFHIWPVNTEKMGQWGLS